jgi:UDP-2,3-diacylglucosamine hydrolase
MNKIHIIIETNKSLNNSVLSITPESGKRFYFASDFHLGIPDYQSSLLREKKLIRWLDHVRTDAAAIFLLGDLFDFWFEYKTVVPKGYTRLFSKLAEITDSGIPVHFFRGNHDFWAFDYLNTEAGVIIHEASLNAELYGKKFFMAHGDGLGPGDRSYKFLKKVFLCRFNQALFRWLHPDLGTRMGLYFSRGSRISNMMKQDKDLNYFGKEQEILLAFARETAIQQPDMEYFVFGHRHVPSLLDISDKAKCIILGDWVKHFTYGIFDGEIFSIEYFEKKL